MAEWLSFWNAQTRLRNEDLQGGPVEGIYVPYGKGKISRGDVIYCVGIDDEELRLITRIRVGSLDDDPEDEESVLIDDAEAEPVDVDLDREVTPGAAQAIEYEHVDGSKHRLPITGLLIDPSPFQGRASIRELREGAAELDSLL
jgi:hypothetical protein